MTARVVPLPLPKNDPIKIKKKIIVEDIILKFIPIIDPIIKNKTNHQPKLFSFLVI